MLSSLPDARLSPVLTFPVAGKDRRKQAMGQSFKSTELGYSGHQAAIAGWIVTTQSQK